MTDQPDAAPAAETRREPWFDFRDALAGVGLLLVGGGVFAAAGAPVAAMVVGAALLVAAWRRGP